ncbi:MAG: bifunctional fucokinase/L-fucose-1-P-guanylyltransferase, partial [Bacteroidota bacterium]
TGITRVAKHILADIVKGMFLNSARHLEILSEMKQHALGTYQAIGRHDFAGLASAIGYSWELNQKLDKGTNPPEVSVILDAILDYACSFKLLGAGGGGFLMIFAKDPVAADRIRSVLKQNPPNPYARFVDWSLSLEGMKIAKS